MAQIFSYVNRGDLITAQSFNEILDKMQEMESRIELLESGSDTGSRVSISNFLPVNEQNIDRTLEIFGSNFEIPPEKNKVTVDGVAVTSFGVSTVQLLRIIIPDINGVPKNAQIQINNINGGVSRLYKVLEKVPVVGDPPVINAVTDANGGPILKIGEQFLINGLNLSTSPLLRLRSREAGRQNDIYNISNIESSTNNQITATLPSEVDLVAGSSFPGGPPEPDSMEIELTVGAFNPVLFAVQVEA